jgi:hypothetical protein
MLATLSGRCSSIRHFDGREQWLQQQLNLCGIPYTRLVNQRISRARQTMDKGGPDARETTQSLTGMSLRRRSCPMRLLVDTPDKLARPSSACGFYKDPPIPMSPQEEEPPIVPQHRSSTPGNFFSSLRKDPRGEESPQVESSQPKIPALIKHYVRGVVPPEGGTEESGTNASQQQPVAGTSLFQD